MAFGLLALGACGRAARSDPSVATPIPSPSATLQPTVAPTPAPTPPPSRWRNYLDRLQLGVRPGYAQFFSPKVRTQFDGGGVSWGASFFRLKPPDRANDTSPDYSLSRTTNGNNILYQGDLGVDYLHYFSIIKPNHGPPVPGVAARRRPVVFPYAGITADCVLGKLQVPAAQIDTPVKLGVSTNLVAGVQYKTRFRAEAGLMLMSAIGGYNFSELYFAVNWKL